MKPFLKSKAGMISILAFAIMIGLVLQRIGSRRRERVADSGLRPKPAAVVPPQPAAPGVAAAKRPDPLAENAAYLERYYALERGTRDDHDFRGNRVTRRETAAVARADAGQLTEGVSPASPVEVVGRASLRLQGKRTPGAAEVGPGPVNALHAKLERLVGLPSNTAVAAPAQKKSRPQRFNPYGRVLKCELVFTIDSTSEECPLVGIVMQPVYNNGALVIPAGAELHGVARPDRLRDRIFSGQEWVLVFPREPGRLSGRQLNVKGVALDRVEPDANGMTWGITDGSYGLEGRVIRTMNDEEIKRFVATFLAGGSIALQDRNTDRGGQQTARNTPQNAVLQGLAANFEKIAEDISAEIQQHGVFIRVPAGHQFYFYPMQIIDPDAADISSDIATVK